jgi:hypothetical protein
MAIQKPILGQMVGYYTTELGPLNQMGHLRAYEHLAEPTERWARLLAEGTGKLFDGKVSLAA